MSIQFLEKKYTDAEIYKSLNPIVAEWFKEKFGKFTEPQKYAIMNIHKGTNTLISAETGTGKTLSAFTAILNELTTLSEYNILEDKVYCIYVSPLRALNNDIQRNLEEPLEEMKKKAEEKNKKIEIRTAVRTGDTTANEKSKMLRKSPHILITTPESLAILLNSPKFSEKLADVKWLIIDEIHSLAENKRGVHLSLSVERLNKKATQMTRIGLSATVAPIEEIAHYLVGNENGKKRYCDIVDVSFLKKTDLTVISPLSNLIDTTAEKIHEKLYEKLDELIQQHKTTVIFTNTRAATERVVHHLKDKFPKNYMEGNLGAHHSSLSREHRLKIETDLKEGKLKAVVCSTSLELGIDIGYIDLVILLGSPKSVARALQRMGRSGHRLHEKVKGRIIVLDRDDLIECSVLLRNALGKKIDRINIPKNALDVLAQHIYGIAIEQPTHIEEIYKLIKQSYNYTELNRNDFNEVINYLAGVYSALEVRHVYAKIWYDEETGMVGKRGKLARVIYMTNLGTIPSEAKVTVKIGNISIGTVEEGFVERLQKGDVFVLGGQTYFYKYSRGMTIQVGAAEKRPPTVPSWFSEQLPLSFDLGESISDFRELMREKFEMKKDKQELLKFIKEYLKVDERAENAIYEYFREQHKYLEIPTNKKIIVERYVENGTKYAFFHLTIGRKANEAIARSMSYLIGRITHKDIEIGITDNGFYLAGDKLPIEHALTLYKSNSMKTILEKAVEKSEIFKRRFRHVATRGLMILKSYKGRTKSVGRQQMASFLLLNAVKQVDENFPILKETRREIMQDAMNLNEAEIIINEINEGKRTVILKNVEFPSPFAFQLYSHGRTDVLKMEERIAFLKRMHEKILNEIKNK